MERRQSLSFVGQLYLSLTFQHPDKSQTHVISMIYHIDSSDDAEPWPLLIEGMHVDLKFGRSDHSSGSQQVLMVV